ncbi:uncharacterized protein K452DRAFT_352032 [Aplosporella prunicola CBS 121167]|uniref:FAD/NAD(P)-binding domain-containing protein n=1 Tax=Aplosporella prunicola CBS 121167 TaxID=1176127 RepID=A0A6A6B9K9_9PEZI|nr:uncharacterized protein K452DRAFT_352032 [Aplosporella prunicola CBS 121167]KAF2140248.1 hypothetical protein K452DRAFT_352032 [Aplosporella prunicola CBS 121167]
MASQEPAVPETLNIVILGASFAGLSVAHNVLTNIMPALGTFDKAPKYRVVLVSPSTHLFWNISAPKCLVSNQLIPYTDSFIRIVDGFDRYPAELFTFIQGTASLLDTDARNVAVTLAAPPTSSSSAHHRTSTASTTAVQALPYHALVLATGSSANSPLLSLHGGHKQTQAALDDFHERLRDANSILVVGGGPSGVETAGQLGVYFNQRSRLARLRAALGLSARQGGVNSDGAAGSNNNNNGAGTGSSSSATRHRSRVHGSSVAWDPPRKPKTITLLSGHDRLLPQLAPSYGIKAERKLRRHGVHVLHNVRLIAATEDGSTGRAACHLNDDTTVQADLYVACTGVYPNTAYMPSRLLDAAGYVVTARETLRVVGGGARVFALGDCAAYSNNYTLDVYEALPAVVANLRNDLLAFELAMRFPSGSERLKAELRALVDKAYVQNPTDTLLMPCSKRGGVGVLFDWNVPSLAVWALKGRDYKVPKARQVVEKGVNPYG